MILTDKILIGRPPEEVWRFIQSPALMKEWDRNIKAVVPVSWGEPAEGHLYRVRYNMNGRESNFLAEFMEYQKPARLLIHLTGGNLPVKGYIQEIFELSENTKGTLLRQRTELHNSGMNVFSRGLMLLRHFISRFSRKKQLRVLKDLIETQ
jgi:uncharacterized protein YndB with AHSA1/START domain